MDFGAFAGSSKGSMRRKQSNSLLQALSGKSNASRVSAIPIPPQAPNTAVSSTSYSDDSHGTPYSPDDAYSNYSHSAAARTASVNGSGVGGRSISGTVATSSTMMASSSGHSHGHGPSREVKKLEDVIGLSKDRLLNWSYLMQWYGGDTHWLNTVKVRRELVEKELGPGKLDQRARQYFILGTSLAMLFDITVAGDFLRALYRLLEEWEVYCEKGAKGMKSLFKSQKAKKDKGELLEAESYLVYINLPFTPDFFAVHATTCSVIRDIYKKMLGMLLPNTDPPLPPGTAPQARHAPDISRSSPSQSLLHPSTFIASAPTDLVLQANPHLSTTLASQISNGVRLDDNASMYSTPQHYHTSAEDGGYTVGRGGRETPYGESAAGYPPDNGPVQRDAFEAYINGELPPSHSLIGDGQQITAQIIETFVKVEAKLKASPERTKQFNMLVKEGDQFARKTLDDEIAYLLGSLNTAAPMQFDYDAAMSGAGNGWQPSPPRSVSASASIMHHHRRLRQPSEPSTASSGSFSIRRPSALVRHGSSDQSQHQHQHPTHPWARSSADHHDSEELEPAMEEHMRDEESPEERRERDFGTV